MVFQCRPEKKALHVGVSVTTPLYLHPCEWKSYQCGQTQSVFFLWDEDILKQKKKFLDTLLSIGYVNGFPMSCGKKALHVRISLTTPFYLHPCEWLRGGQGQYCICVCVKLEWPCSLFLFAWKWTDKWPIWCPYCKSSVSRLSRGVA